MSGRRATAGANRARRTVRFANLAGSYRRAWTAPRGAGSLIRDARLQSDAFSADLSRDSLLQAEDSFALRLSQPLRVVRGGFALSLPVAYSYAGEKTRLSASVSSAYSRRDLSGAVRFRLGLQL